MPDQDFGKEPSKITHRTRVALPMVTAVSAIGAVIYGAWTLSRYAAGQEATQQRTAQQLNQVIDDNRANRAKLEEVNVRLIRLEFKVDGDESTRRRRP